MTRSRPTALFAPLVSAALAIGGAWASDSPARPLDVRGLPVPAWQADAELAREWQLFSGRYIFERSCSGCHDWGPAHKTRDEWANFLSGFPSNHEPDVSQDYLDLTAQFAPGRMVPGSAELLDALSTFLLAEAPLEVGQKTDVAWSGLPELGDPAPDFRFVDLDGREHTRAGYLGKKRLVLVMSRAYW